MGRRHKDNEDSSIKEEVGIPEVDPAELPGIEDEPLPLEEVGQGEEPPPEDLAKLPGSRPLGSVTCHARNGELLTVPVDVAEMIEDWLGKKPSRGIDAGRVYEDRVVVVSYPDGQKASFRL